jgi:hypothetical protein
MKVGNLVKVRENSFAAHKTQIGEIGLVTRISPNGANLTVQLFNGTCIGLLADTWFEVVA